MIKSNKITKSLVQSVKSSPVSDLLKEYTELGVDAFIENDTYKAIPVINTIVAACKLGISINDRLLIGKITKFIFNLNDITLEEKEETIFQLENDPKYKRKVGEFLLEVLGKVESEKKPEMLAKVFKARAREQITIEMFYRLYSSIETISLIDVPESRKFLESSPEQRMTFNHVFCQSLVNAGLATAQSAFDSIIYKPNEIFEKFIELDLDL